MVLTAKIKVDSFLCDRINSVAKCISTTISSLAPRSVPTEVVGDNLVKVQRLGSEIGINNLPTSARQLNHKVIKACEACFVLELTSKYNFQDSYAKTGEVLCRKCSQSTKEEHVRRSNNQIRLNRDPGYRKNNSAGMVKSAKLQTEAKIERYCSLMNLKRADFVGFPKNWMPYPLSFNRKLKESIKLRDGFECKACFVKNKPLDIHHVDFKQIQWRWFKPCITV